MQRQAYAPIASTTQETQFEAQQQIAADALSEFHYITFLHAVITLAELKKQNPELAEIKRTDLKISSNQILAFRIFVAVWNDQHNVKVNNDENDAKKGERDTQYLAARNSLSDTRQKLVDDGIRFLQPIIDPTFDAKSSAEKGKIEIKNHSKEDFVKEQDAEAYEAITTYRSAGQKVRDLIGVSIGWVTAFAFGAIEAGTAIALLLPLLLPASWPLYVVYSITYLITIPLAALATWVNWNQFKEAVPRQLNQFIGKNDFFDGVGEYVDTEDTKTGERKVLDPSLVRFVKVFALLIAFPTGIAIGALGYTATLSIAQLPWLGQLVSMMGLGVYLSPIGIGIAVVVAACMTLLFTDSITRLVQHNKDIWQAFKIKKPFEDIAATLEKNNASPLAKFLSYGVTVLLAAVGLLGLAMACFTSSRSIGIFLMNQFQAAPQIAATIGRIVAVPAFICRAWWTFENMVKTGVAIVTRMVYANNNKNSNKSGDVSKGEISNESTNEIRNALIMGTVEAFEEGTFYGIAGMLAQQDSSSVIGLAATTTAVRTWGANIKALVPKPKDDAEIRAKSQASIKRRKGILIPNDFEAPAEFTARRGMAR